MFMLPEVKEAIEKVINDDTIVIFMKGTPEFPQCGFSAVTVECFERIGAKYSAFNVLSNEAVRQGIKEYSNWPTIPQVYIKGQFVGGCDITRDMFASGELAEAARDAGALRG